MSLSIGPIEIHFIAVSTVQTDPVCLFRRRFRCFAELGHSVDPASTLFAGEWPCGWRQRQQEGFAKSGTAQKERDKEEDGTKARWDGSLKWYLYWIIRMKRIQLNRKAAQSIDQRCRIYFPLAFLLFNLFYWSYYMLIASDPFWFFVHSQSIAQSVIPNDSFHTEKLLYFYAKIT